MKKLYFWLWVLVLFVFFIPSNFSPIPSNYSPIPSIYSWIPTNDETGSRYFLDSILVYCLIVAIVTLLLVVMCLVWIDSMEDRKDALRDLPRCSLIIGGIVWLLWLWAMLISFCKHWLNY